MELILIKDVEKVGRRGDVVKVSEGYARNFLIPRKLAFAATRENQSFVAEQKVRSEKRRVREKEASLQKAKELEKIGLVIHAAAGEQDKLYGSITAQDIQEALAAQGFEIDKKKILLKEPIRSLGEYAVQVELFPQVRAQVKLEIARQAS
ncbi:MAG: 50S ribosomal protein L9 [Candidatus Omnitrophota bacterium]